MSSQIEFAPKAGGGRWTADLLKAADPGYDVALFMDKKDFTSDSGWMLELSVDPDSMISGRITAHPGYDALAIFTCSQDTLRITDNGTGPHFAITDRIGSPVSHVAEEAPREVTPSGYEAMYVLLLATIRNVVEGARAIDDAMNDLEHDGRNAQCPTGDSYNELWGEMGPLFDLMPRIEETVPVIATVPEIVAPADRPLPPDPEGMNYGRSQWAAGALSRFQHMTNTDDEDVLSDLLCDLMHWADRNGQDFAAVLARAKGDYADETRAE